MKAIVFSGVRGKPTEVLTLKQKPKPTPGQGQVLARVILVPIHPSTFAGIKPGNYPGPGADEIISTEGVGIIEAHGQGTEGAPPVGTRVLLLGAVGGTYSEYTLLWAKALVPIPDSVSDQNAAQLIVNPLSALLMVKDIPRGEWLLQTGASSVLGKNVIQLSKHFGFKTINLVRNATHVKDLVDLGADAVITTNEDVSAKIKEITEGKGVKYAIDPVGGDVTSIVLQNMSYGGKISIFGQLAAEDIHFPSGLLVVKLLTLSGFWLVDWFKTAAPEVQKETLINLIGLFSSGVLNCPVDKEFVLEEFVAAIQASNTPGRGGKVLLRISK